MRNRTRNLTLAKKEPGQTGTQIIFNIPHNHTTWMLSTFHQENPPTWAGVVQAVASDTSDYTRGSGLQVEWSFAHGHRLWGVHVDGDGMRLPTKRS
ncbi:hypothetical protein TNCV_2487641 [Trichonephila clavipes]|uniref:Uncharacterized protein n=1 Tax=Trichonephila clavipes TaxID=2585209 RepID=A0A8X6W033_TRICX|nr:hypothetical protein TNCV_2487641 [Trichonephila clavipes]